LLSCTLEEDGWGLMDESFVNPASFVEVPMAGFTTVAGTVNMQCYVEGGIGTAPANIQLWHLTAIQVSNLTVQ